MKLFFAILLVIIPHFAYNISLSFFKVYFYIDFKNLYSIYDMICMVCILFSVYLIYSYLLKRRTEMVFSSLKRDISSVSNIVYGIYLIRQINPYN